MADDKKSAEVEVDAAASGIDASADVKTGGPDKKSDKQKAKESKKPESEAEESVEAKPSSGSFKNGKFTRPGK